MSARRLPALGQSPKSLLDDRSGLGPFSISITGATVLRPILDGAPRRWSIFLPTRLIALPRGLIRLVGFPFVVMVVTATSMGGAVTWP